MKKISKVLLIALIAFFILSRAFTTAVTDWWWYQEIHNTVFFLKSFQLKWLTFAGAFLIVALPSFISIAAAHRLAPMRLRILNGNILEYPDHLTRPYLFPLLYGFAAFIAFLVAVQAALNWALLLPLFGHPWFHQPDPIFRHDVGFYVFVLPMLENFYQLAATGFVIALILAGIAYGIQKAIRFSQTGFKMEPVASAHFSILLGVLALIKSFGYFIGRYDLLLTRQGAVFGIGYADFHARLPWLAGMSGIALITAFLFFLNIKLHNWKPIIGASLLWLAASMLLIFYPGLIQQFRVVPSELDKERPFLENNIALTRAAYGLDAIQERHIAPSPLTASDLKAHQATLENIRLWDRRPLLQSLAQLQEIRPYYTFVNVDVDRYMMGGRLRQVMLSARELDYNRIQNPTWANEHLIFTHGYGFVASPVNQATPEGLPAFFVKDIPPAGSPELHVDSPEIYYGESGNEYAVVNSKQPEFNYPSGDANNSTHYQGLGGVTLDSWGRRLMFASRFTYQILFSSDIDSKSKIMFYRTISERLNQAFPLLVYDRDPYPVITQGKIVWICDAYTVADHFPYSNPVQFHENTYNYIRNSVKAVVDSYNGSVTYYISDPSDPVIQLYARSFPGLFHPLSEMPAGLKTHLRVPEDLFMTQASVYSLYHMTDPAVFYNQEDRWQIPKAGEEEEIRPYYVIMQMPGSSEPEFVLMLPFTPNKKDNLAAWMAARCDPARYGQEMVFEFSKENLAYGPAQVAARINQDPKFSQLRTLWGQQGSRINVGHLQVIPVGNSILYVEPLYLQAEQKQLPELKLVLLAYGDKIAIEDTLEKALASVFAAAPASSPASTGKESSASAAPSAAQPAASREAQLHEALAHYQKAMEYQKQGDWSRYGAEIRALGQILQSLSGQK